MKKLSTIEVESIADSINTELEIEYGFELQSEYLDGRDTLIARIEHADDEDDRNDYIQELTNLYRSYYDSELESNFKGLLQEKGVTAYALSKATGIAQTTLSSLVRNQVSFDNTSLGNALKISQALGMELDELVDFLGLDHIRAETIA